MGAIGANARWYREADLVPARGGAIFIVEVMDMAEKQEFVREITPRSVDFAQWYTDVILKADLVDYAPVRGCMVMKPYGNRIWELIQADMDGRFKETGHENVAMPLLIPESLLLKEAQHIEGFAPEVAWVTHGGDEKLPERLAIRPTSETLFCAMYAKWIKSWRDLPMLYNQWCSVMRWEKSTRPFLRTAEFWWQEGHTMHATAQEAQEETMRMLGVYQAHSEEVLAMPVITGRKSDKEKFAGARATYGMESMMQDGKSLQAATSHNFGTNFSEVFDVKYLDKDGALKYAHETSWGSSTRLIGGLIMTHSDDRGLVLPPRVAPIQIVVLPIAMHKEGVLDKARAVAAELEAAGLRVKLDERDTQSAGWKFNEWEMRGVPIRMEIGPRDIEAGVATVCRRDTLEKLTLPLQGVAQAASLLLGDIQSAMFQRAAAFRDGRLSVARDMDGLMRGVQEGFVRTMWCGERACEDRVKAETSATSRVMPFDQTPVNDCCAVCGAPARNVIYWAKAY